MKGVMQRVQPIEGKMVPPRGAKAYTVTPEGKQVYILVTKRSGHRPKLDEQGERIWRKHPVNGEPLTPVNEITKFEHEEIFTLEDEGNGNVRKVPYSPPTEAEIAAEKRQARIAANRAALDEALADSPLSPAEIVARLTTPVAPAPRAEAAPVEEAGDEAEDEKPTPKPAKDGFPKQAGGNRWRLSNGETMQGTKKEAQAAEDALPAEQKDQVQQAAKDVADSPEY